MFNKFKTATVAAITAAATLLASTASVNAFTGDASNYNWTPASYGLSSGPLSGSNCNLFAVAGPDDFGGGEVAYLILWRNQPAFQASLSSGAHSIAWGVSGPPFEVYYVDPGSPPATNAQLQGCGFTSARNYAGFSPDISIHGTDIRDFTGDYGFSFDFDDAATGQGYTCRVGWFGGFGSAIQNQCSPLYSTSPKVTLSSATTTLTGTDPFTVTATFDEDVTGFDDLANDITIANGTVTGITAVSATVYTLAVTPTGAGDVSITVPAAAAQDAASNDNTASNTLVIGNTIVEDTQKAIADFMLGRANNLASNQPGLKRFLPGTFQNTFYAAVTRGNGTLSGAFAQDNTWAELTGSWSGDDNYALGSFGAHSFVNPNLLIGGMLQFDYAEDSANNASGNGYMVGPYFVAQVPDQPLFLEGRLLYGQTDNKISPLGTYTDSFETERWLAQVRATGKYQYMATTLMPLLDLTYTDDSQKAYTDSLGNVIPGQTVSLIQVSAGMDFSTPISVPTGALELTGGLSGIYSASDGAAAAPEFENWRGRTHLGLNYGMASGANLSATTFYDGIGTDYESYGASLGFDMKF